MSSTEQQVTELTRGIVELHDLPGLVERISSGRPLRVKAGFDPTRPDLHLGHMVLMQKLRQFQDFGHQVIFLVGDFTAMLGDPTGRNAMRPQLTRAEVLEAAETYTEQAFLILDRERTEIRYNSEWLSKLALSDVISLCAKRTVARTLERRDFRERLDTQRDVYMHELLYPMLQGYDSVALDADIELGGTDQLFNLLVGRDLMRAYGKPEQLVMTTPLLEGLDARCVDGVVVGKKMSKSADNYIALTEAPLEMFRKCMQLDDTLIWRYFELLSAKSVLEISSLRSASDALSAKRTFANEMLTRFHSPSAAAEAAREFERAYLGHAAPEDIPECVIPAQGDGLPLAKALAISNLVKSNGEGRRLIEQGGVELDGLRVTDPQLQLERGRTYLARVGSKQRRFCRIVVPE